MKPDPPLQYPYVWTWKRRLPERRGQFFRVVARGALNTCMAEFSDGQRFVTSRNALRRRGQPTVNEQATGN